MGSMANEISRGPSEEEAQRTLNLQSARQAPRSLSDKQGTVGRSAPPPPPPAAQMQRLLPLKPPGTICRTMWAQRSLGRASSSGTWKMPGGRRLASENPHQKNAPVCLPTRGICPRGRGSVSPSITLQPEPEGEAPRAGPVDILALKLIVCFPTFPPPFLPKWRLLFCGRDGGGGGRRLNPSLASPLFFIWLCQVLPEAHGTF